MELKSFKVTKYRNIADSGWIDVNDITALVGQNESGKSNLFEALYRINPFVPQEAYNIDEDWPVDDWGNKSASELVCEAKFALSGSEISDLFSEAALPNPKSAETSQDGEQVTDHSVTGGDASAIAKIPSELILSGSRSYAGAPKFVVEGEYAKQLDVAKVDAWAKKHAPKFVLIQDYGLSLPNWRSASRMSLGIN
jgi:hypothetical protein